MSNDFLLELDKIANFSTDVTAPDDVASEPMVPDTAPHVDPKTVEMLQTTNAEIPTDADNQLPSNPEDDKALADAIGEAQQQYEAAKEHLASLEEEWASFEKTAEEIKSLLPSMGALARLIHYSTDGSIPEHLNKLASERLITALKDEDGYHETIQKTAEELFEDQETIEQLYSKAGMEYVIEHLASFAESEELEKVAFEIGGIANAARDMAKDYVEGAQKFWKLSDEIKAADVALNEAKDIMLQKERAMANASAGKDIPSFNKFKGEFEDSRVNLNNAMDNKEHLTGLYTKGAQVWGAGGAGVAGGAFIGGKAIANARKSHDGLEEQLSEKNASVTINLEDNAHIKGGKPEMSIVRDYLKIAGAAGLLEIANNEQADVAMRKEAADTFNAIARMSRSDMEASFEKMATTIYSEPQLHEIVAGKHNEYLFDKIAYFVEAAEMGADDLEKVAGADGVAAKGVGGALTDAKSNIEEKLEQDKNHTETVKNGELGTRKPDDMRGYNVINNPGAYKVEKTAGLSAILEEAQMQKEAAYRAFVEADTFIKLNS